jgi:predicted metalloprotease with PDZ domain
MSRHLWLYEGLTEYAAHHAQLQAGLIDLQAYLDRQVKKMHQAKSFDNALSFTEMSGGVLDKHKKQYQNVYYKGALIGLALDLRLRQLSKGKYGTQNLLSDLSKKYGTDRSFKDEALFDEIARLSYPEIRTFFKQYVEGAAPLPFRELFSSIGVHFDPKAKKKEVQYALGIQFKAEKETGYLVMDSIYEPLDLTKRLGIKVGDRVRKMNGQEFNFSTYQSVFQGLKKTYCGRCS